MLYSRYMPIYGTGLEADQKIAEDAGVLTKQRVEKTQKAQEILTGSNPETNLPPFLREKEAKKVAGPQIVKYLQGKTSI